MILLFHGAMFSVELFMQLLIALGLGLLIGLEREKKSRNTNRTSTLVDIRSFGLVALLGYIGGFFNMYADTMLVGVVLLIVVAVFASISYYIDYNKNNQAGITTEMTLVLTYLIGLLVGYELQTFAIGLTLVIVLLLILGLQLSYIEEKITKEELFDSLKFGIIAFVILPLLPNTRYGSLELFNPYHTWLMVVFVSGIGFAGYALTKIVGTQKGIGLTGMIGGLVSSTAVTTSLAQVSKNLKNLNPFVFGILISSTIMFVRVAVEVFAFNRPLFNHMILPFGAMILVGLLLSGWYWWGSEKDAHEEVVQEQLPLTSPFALKPALLFGAFFAGVILISKLSVEYLPTSSLYLISILSGLADVDAITLTIASMDTLAQNVAAQTILLAVATNTFVKAGIVFMFGNRKLAKIIITLFAVCILAGVVGYLFI